VAAVVGYAIYGAITGFTPVFGEVPARFDVGQLPLFALLGLISGAVAYVYVKVFYYFHDKFKSWHTSPYVKPLVGGLAVGALGIIAPQILGVGYGWVSLLIQEQPSAFYSPILPAALLTALLPFLKILATSLTVGSGGSGGIVAPSFVIGAFVGYDTYLIFKMLFPSLVSSAAPFIVVGMLTLFGAASKAPLATTIMVVEMTGSYDLLPAAIIAVAVARLVSGEDSLYRSQVPTRRDSPAHLEKYRVPLLMEIVADCALDKEPVVKYYDDVKKATTIMTTRRTSALPVVDDYGNFLGAIHLFELLDKSGRVEKYTKKIPHIRLSLPC